MSSDAFFDLLSERANPAEERRARDNAAADELEARLHAGQRRMHRDRSRMKALRTPRRSGKSFGTDVSVLVRQLRKPGTKALIISLTKAQTREAHWATLQQLNADHDLGIVFHETALRWTLPNGSTGFLAGAEKLDEIERLRGGEDDIAVVDEPGSFSPRVLTYLINDILEPRLTSRDGELWLTGTPGQALSGPFYRATNPSDPENVLKDEDGNALFFEGKTSPTAVPYQEGVELEEAWSFHTWDVQANTAVPGQWRRFQAKKRREGWGDDHPTWRREYLGEWVRDDSGRVYAYAGLPAVRVQWVQEKDPNSLARHGLPPGDWRLVLGLDFGFEDDFAMVVVAYSQERQEMRHVWDFKEKHLTVADMVTEIRAAQSRFGPFTGIVADAGALGKVLVETLVTDHGIPVERADKHQKYDYIELVNSDFHSGRLKVLPHSDLAKELEELVWDLSKGDRKVLVRSGKLREHPGLPNHLCDALLYSWRYCYHRWRVTREVPPTPGTPEAARAADDAAFARAVATRRLAREELARETELLNYTEESWN